MVTREKIRHLLGIVQRNYGKHPAWADESVGDWFQALIKYSDEEAELAVRHIVRTRDKLPTASVVIEAIRGQRQLEPGGVEVVRGCGRCAASGWVEIARWMHSRGKLEVTTWLAACSCPKGARLAVGAAQPWEVMVAEMRKDPFVEQVYHGEPGRPHLTREQRLHPDIVARMQAAARPASVGPWQQLTEGA